MDAFKQDNPGCDCCGTAKDPVCCLPVRLRCSPSPGVDWHIRIADDLEHVVYDDWVRTAVGSVEICPVVPYKLGYKGRRVRVEATAYDLAGCAPPIRYTAEATATLNDAKTACTWTPVYFAVQPLEGYARRPPCGCPATVGTGVSISTSTGFSTTATVSRSDGYWKCLVPAYFTGFFEVDHSVALFDPGTITITSPCETLVIAGGPRGCGSVPLVGASTPNPACTPTGCQLCGGPCPCHGDPCLDPNPWCSTISTKYGDFEGARSVLPGGTHVFSATEIGVDFTSPLTPPSLPACCVNCLFSDPPIGYGKAGTFGVGKTGSGPVTVTYNVFGTCTSASCTKTMTMFWYQESGDTGCTLKLGARVSAAGGLSAWGGSFSVTKTVPYTGCGPASFTFADVTFPDLTGCLFPGCPGTTIPRQVVTSFAETVTMTPHI